MSDIAPNTIEAAVHEFLTSIVQPPSQFSRIGPACWHVCGHLYSCAGNTAYLLVVVRIVGCMLEVADMVNTNRFEMPLADPSCLDELERFYTDGITGQVPPRCRG